MSGVDQLFDRFGDLLKSWTRSDGSSGRPFSDPKRDSGGSHSGDPLLDEAMQELDAFLDDDRDAQERLRRQREARAEAEERARTAGSRQSGSSGAAGSAAGGPPAKLLAAYKVLGLTYGVPFDQAKATYKKLLKEHHPDKHGSSPDNLKKATETSARINNAYRIIETWHDTGTIGDE